MSKERLDLVKCPECGKMLQLDEFDEIGDIMLCHDCNSELELVRVSPPKLRRVEDRGYDGEESEEEPGGKDKIEDTY